MRCVRRPVVASSRRRYTARSPYVEPLDSRGPGRVDVSVRGEPASEFQIDETVRAGPQGAGARLVVPRGCHERRCGCIFQSIREPAAVQGVSADQLVQPWVEGGMTPCAARVPCTATTRSLMLSTVD